MRSPRVRLQITRNIGLLRLGLRSCCPMASVPRGTQCDFGGTGAAKRKGCTLPRKIAARASQSEAVLQAVHRAVLRVRTGILLIVYVGAALLPRT